MEESFLEAVRSLWASSTQTFENGIMADWAAWNEADDHPTVAYPESFDVKAISAHIQELISLVSSEAGIVPRQVAVRMAVPIVERILRDNGETELAIGEIKAAMEAHGKAVPNEPQPGVMQPEAA